MREHELVYYTHRLISDVTRRSQGPFTHLCRAGRGRKRAKVTLSPAKTTVLHFRYWSERNSSFNFLYSYYRPVSSAVTRTFETAVAKVYQSTAFLGCARRGQRAVGDPSTTGLCVYV